MTGIRAAFTVCLLATFPGNQEIIDKSDIMSIVSDKIRSIIVGSVTIDSALGNRHLPTIVKMMNPEQHPAIQLSCAMRCGSLLRQEKVNYLLIEGVE